jgi:hypothetical protein
MPQLRRTSGSGISKGDSILTHTLDWNLLQSQLQTVAHKLDRRFYVEGFGPFIIATNIPRKRLEEIKEKTIRLSYNAFYKDFFTERPRNIITLYLFKNYTDYSFYSRKLFNETPTTPYGYYRSADRALMINVSTGEGTIVHEMAHALIDVDFPEVPTWFNEGFASLFEQNRVEEGSISGLTNWRYPILKRAIDANELVKLSRLVNTTNDEFYDDDDGYNYAEARYLCYYLQEKDLLKVFYSRFREKFYEDPTGLKTLEEIMQKDIESIENDWLQWARTLPSNMRRVSG